MLTLRRSSRAALGLALFLAPLSAFGIDSVYRKSQEKSTGGTITTINANEVVVTQKIGNREEKVPANDITRIEWDAEPADMKKARSFEGGLRVSPW